MSLISTYSTPDRAMTDLTLLTDNRSDGVQIVRILNARGIKTAETFCVDEPGSDRRKKLAFWKGRGGVKVSTLHSFKGWEARLLIVFITKCRDDKDRALTYTGLTRLKRHQRGSCLTVICSEKFLKPFGKRWPDYQEATKRFDTASAVFPV
jgi:hypothetical protein